MLYSDDKLMNKLLAAMHDQKKHITKFKSHFNGDITKTIRFIFDIYRYSEITNFKDPHSIFTHIYNALSENIQGRISVDKHNVVLAQIAEEQQLANDDDENETNTIPAEKYEEAQIYSIESIQAFLISIFRPSITRSNIFAALKSI